MSASEDWLASDFTEQLKKLDRGALSFEFLRRNKNYRDDYRTTLEHIASASVDIAKEVALSQLAARWGWFFPSDPALAAAVARPLWRPDISPVTVIVSAVPEGFAGASTIDPSTLPVAGQLLGNGFHAVIEDEAGIHRVWFQGGITPFKAALVIPRDEHYALRSHSTERFARWLDGKPSGSLSRQQQISSYELHRYALMLRAADGAAAGASRRQLAGVLLNKDVMTLRAVDWKNAPERRRINRLLSATGTLIGGGYLQLLRGKPLPIHLFRRR